MWADQWLSVGRKVATDKKVVVVHAITFLAGVIT
jgi:hypothetical protein